MDDIIRRVERQGEESVGWLVGQRHVGEKERSGLARVNHNYPYLSSCKEAACSSSGVVTFLTISIILEP